MKMFNNFKYLSLIIIAVFCLFYYAPFLNAENSVDEYKVGNGDILRVVVINEPKLNTTSVVASDGTITFPYLGSVYVKGMKITEIQKEISDKLGECYIKYSVVSVSLIKSINNIFYVYGEVKSTGRFDFAEFITIQKAISIWH